MKTPAFPTSLQRVFLSAIAASSLFSASHAFGQVNGPGPSAPSLFDNVINIPMDQATISNLESIGGVDGETTQFNLSDGGSVGALFEALSGAEVNISGGTVGDPLNPEFEALRAFIGSELNVSGGAIGNRVIVRGATFNLSGGTIGDNLLIETESIATITGGEIGFGTIAESATINISGGTIGDFFRTQNATFTISGGEIGNDFIIGSESTIDISGGTFGARFEASGAGNITGGKFGNGAEVSGTVVVSGGEFGALFEAFGTGNITGGKFGDGAEVDGTVVVSGGEFGNEFVVRSGVTISGGTFGTDVRGTGFELRGSEFKLNGIPFGNNTLTIDSFIAQNDGDVFTGVLEDGSPFIIAALSSDSIRDAVITNVPVPAADLAPIVVNTAFPDLPSGLRAGQSLTVQGGGILGNNFEIVDATVNVDGGTIGDEFGMSRSTVNLNGGAIGDGFHSHRGCVINLNGGTIGDDLRTFLDSVVTLNEGAIGDNFRPEAGSEFYMSGGRLGHSFGASSGPFAADSLVRISGGTFGRNFRIFSDDVELSGGEFQLNGADYGESTIDLTSFTDVFTGTLSDGTGFILARAAGDNISNLKLNLTAVPDADTTPIVVSAATPNGPASLRSGQTLTLEQGGVIDGEFEAVSGVININGGSFAGETAFLNTIVNLNDGSIGDNALAHTGNVFNINGGTIGDDFTALAGSVVNISGGTIGDDFRTSFGSEVNISGGSLGRNFEPDGTVRISGGTFARGADLLLDDAELLGGEFQLDGVDYNESTVRSSSVFSGTLPDGSTFIFSGREGDSILFQLTPTALPNIATDPIVVSSSTAMNPTGLRAGETLILEQGAVIDGHFDAIGGSITINGGGFEGDKSFANTTVDLNAGSITGSANFYTSTINLNDGFLRDRVVAAAGTQFNLFGGTVGGLIAASDSEINIYGDVFETNSATDQSKFTAQAFSTVNLFGTEFFIDGNPVEFTDVDTPLPISDRGFVLSGVFRDGSEFEYTVNSISFSTLEVNRLANLQLNLVTPSVPVLLGDVNLDRTVDFLDISPFISVLSAGEFQAEADLDENGEVDFLDISPFIAILSGL